MDARNGDIYPSKKDALDALVPEEQIVVGPEKTLRRLARLIRRDIVSHRRKRRAIQRRSRRANRG